MSRLLAMTLLLLAGLVPASATTFATDRLQSIAKCLQLPGLDNLTEGNYTHYKYRAHALNVRVNKYGEIEHIGLCLFPEWRRNVSPSPIYDFLERNLLERNLPNIDENIRFKLGGEHVTFLKGNAQTALSVDSSDVNNYIEDRIDFKTYRVSWSKNEREVLRITFDMDYQMLSGCNSIELDSRFMKMLRRFQPHPHQTKELKFPEQGNNYVVAGDTFLIREFRNDLYYEYDGKKWHLTHDANAVSKVLSNMMISLDFSGNPQLAVSLDQHSDIKDVLELPYKNWLQLCIDEGCVPYFGIKERTSSAYKGTVLLANARGGYAHLLSVTIPVETLLNGGNGPIRGYLFVYIPLHNVSKDYFKK